MPRQYDWELLGILISEEGILCCINRMYISSVPGLEKERVYRLRGGKFLSKHFMGSSNLKSQCWGRAIFFINALKKDNQEMISPLGG